ncbi:MAG: hypothetical protein MI807_05805 [Verrucomicrobiales bacterium]|nr:hypothetical protein [Verrucomicrobiales bacterium]
MNENPDSSVPKPRPGAKAVHVALFSFFVAMWLVPILYNGLFNTGIRHAGKWANNLYRVACLFPRRVETWSNYYVELSIDGEEKPTAFHLSEFGGMNPFGYTPRLHRMIVKSRGTSTESELMADLAAYIKEEFARQNPFRPSITEVRFVRVVFRSGSPELAHPDGRWEIPRLEETPVSSRYLLGAYRLQNREPGVAP